MTADTAQVLAGIDDTLGAWQEEAMQWAPGLLPRLTEWEMTVARQLSADTGCDGYAAVLMVADTLTHWSASPFAADVALATVRAEEPLLAEKLVAASARYQAVLRREFRRHREVCAAWSEGRLVNGRSD